MDTNEIRQTLEDKLKTLVARVSKIQSHLRDPGPSDSQELVTARENDEVLERLDESERAEIDDIRAALGRLDAGTYGVCVSCGEGIPEKRLEAVPYTSRCVGCAK